MTSNRDGSRPIFDSQPQLQAGYWYLYILPVLLLAFLVAVLVKFPSVYWMFPGLTALLAIFGTYRIRITTTYQSTLIWLVVVLGANVGMFVWLVPVVQRDLVPPF